LKRNVRLEVDQSLFNVLFYYLFKFKTIQNENKNTLKQLRLSIFLFAYINNPLPKNLRVLK